MFRYSLTVEPEHPNSLGLSRARPQPWSEGTDYYGRAPYIWHISGPGRSLYHYEF